MQLLLNFPACVWILFRVEALPKPFLRCFLRQAWLSHWFLTMKTPMEKIAQAYVSVSFVKAKRGSSNCTCTGCEGGTEESPYLDMLSLHPVVCDVLLPKISNKYTQAKGNEVPLNQASDDVILPKYKNCWSRPMSLVAEAETSVSRAFPNQERCQKQMNTNNTLSLLR